MRRFTAILAMAVSMVAAPVAQADSEAAPAAPEEIFVYENAALGLCYHCLRVRIAVMADGGVAITRWQVGPWASQQGPPSLSRERVARVRIRRFLRALAPYRPSEQQARVPLLSACSVFVTEAGGLTMIWNDMRGQQRLNVDYGCDPARYRAMFDALHHAPDVLGLGDVLGAVGPAIPTKRRRIPVGSGASS